MSIAPNTRYNNSLDALKGGGELDAYFHPDYRYHKRDWDLIRDCIAGERRVKEQGTKYLPSLGDNAGTDYDSYRDRAVFTNMTARTLGGWLGTVFRRPIKIDNMPDAKMSYFDEVTPDGVNANLYSKRLLQELLTTGRIGVLVDRDENGMNKPYAASYLAENILSWRTVLKDGKQQLVYVLLREIVEKRHYIDTPETVQNPVVQRLFVAAAGGERGAALSARYRVLRLDNAGEYVQDVYEYSSEMLAGKTRSEFKAIKKTSKPTIGGAPMREIPFYVAGPNGLDYGVQRAPLLDVANLNIAHYRTSAQLEHGRYFTALPVYFVPQTDGGGEGEGEYTVGPSVVWEVPLGSRPGILEYYGTGLGSLTASLAEKESHIEQLGGRVAGAGARPQGSDSADVFAAKQSNETSILLGATDAIGALMTKVMRLMLSWDRVDGASKVVVRLNQDFKLQGVGARELRAVALLYQSGILPIDDVYRVLQESEYVGEDVTLETFKKNLNDLAQFPNQPDVEAMHEGYPDAASRLKVEETDKDRTHQSEMQRQMTDETIETDDNAHELELTTTRLQQEFEAKQAELDRKTQEKTAKAQAKAQAKVAKAGGKPAAAKQKK